ncbi:MAG: hypothetical protein N3F05_01265 [Candidatus Diapherotrites archaeon]|nr:hypothetical protein [Candidatus Diapherotrites archaeon]
MPEELLLPKKQQEKVIKRIEEKHDELKGLLDNLQKEMEIINKARENARVERQSFFSKKNEPFLELIDVPPLKILKGK